MARPDATGRAPQRLAHRLPLTLPLLLLLLLPDAATARRQLPQSLRDRDVFCETCYAVTTEMFQIVKRATDGSLEQRIDEALSRVCSKERLGRYFFPAEQLTGTCRDLIATLENDLGLGFMAAFQPGTKPRTAATVKDICVTRMKACKKTSEIPSVRQKKDASKASKTSSPSTNSAEGRPSPPPEAASAQTASDVTSDGSADQSSRPPTAAGKDEL